MQPFRKRNFTKHTKKKNKHALRKPFGTTQNPPQSIGGLEIPNKHINPPVNKKTGITYQVGLYNCNKTHKNIILTSMHTKVVSIQSRHTQQAASRSMLKEKDYLYMSRVPWQEDF